MLSESFRLQASLHLQEWDPSSLTRMGPTSAEVQTRERAAVVGVHGHWAGEVELVQGHGRVEYVLGRQDPVVSSRISPLGFLSASKQSSFLREHLGMERISTCPGMGLNLLRGLWGKKEGMTGTSSEHVERGH